MNAQEYRRNNPDFGYRDDIIDACLAGAENIVDRLTGGAQIEDSAREYAVAVQTTHLLAHYGEEPGDCDEVSLAAVSALIRGGLKTEVLYGEL